MRTCDAGPACLMNFAPPPPYAALEKHLRQRHPWLKMSRQENTAVKKNRTKLRTQQLVKQAREVVANDAENALIRDLGAVERALAKSGTGQQSYGLAFAAHRLRTQLAAIELARKGVPLFDNFAGVNGYMLDPSGRNTAAVELRTSRAATTRGIGAALGRPVNDSRPRRAPTDVMQDVLSGGGHAETLQTFEVQVHALRKQLADATSPWERERIGYMLARKELVLAHIRGEI